MTNAPSATAEPGQMSHREIMEALTGLLLAMFVAMLSSTVVSNALPAIVTDLHGSQTGYTWVVVATLLTMTRPPRSGASSPTCSARSSSSRSPW